MSVLFLRLLQQQSKRGRDHGENRTKHELSINSVAAVTAAVLKSGGGSRQKLARRLNKKVKGKRGKAWGPSDICRA